MNILLCCSAGMSTSLLVTKMEAAAMNGEAVLDHALTLKK